MPAHAPVALTRDLMQQAEDRFGSLIDATRRHRFRSPGDLPPVLVATNLNALIWDHRPADPLYEYVDCPTLPAKLARLARDPPTFIVVNNCIGKEMMTEMTETLDELIAQLHTISSSAGTSKLSLATGDRT